MNSELEMYLAGLADSDLFGSFALLALILALTGLHPGSWNSKIYRLLTFITLMSFVMMHSVGTYYLNQSPA
ncbi:hypothetical protein [Pseudomonas frederiksbergensis]|uniref:hypothetical protein n=1 Tax=Pseudomonas frederiksbergensis TaxID=104087 RepID=UPI003D22440C